MRCWIIIPFLVLFLSVPAKAMEFQAPQVPDSGEAFMPNEPETFSEGVWAIVKEGIRRTQPAITQAAGICLCLIAVSLLGSLVNVLPGSSLQVTELAGSIAVAGILLKSSNTLIQLGMDTVRELSEYGKLLTPVLTAALAAQGGATSSAALYSGTILFNTVLSALITSILTPLIYIFLCLATAKSAIGADILGKLQDFVKWLMTWSLKIMLYVFTGYIGITGVVSGTTDAAALKAAKLTISGVVPVVGGILSEASEAVLVSAGVMKNAAGVYGLLSILAVWIHPFLEIGIQYLMLKSTCAICGVFGVKSTTKLIQDFSTAMGLLLAMTGAVCLLLLISIVCFMKGVG